ncbi:MAG: hypothetical protein NC206_03885 [Bacteroides sp.]|nr:hypothetical protein [Roseburia sp.]MCM1346207.1 hypothetical protein [Bacteroides sp.]MCM1419966.1 hypothetical protein [Bacteroides sp.]
MKRLFTLAALTVASATCYVANAQRVEGELKVGDVVTIDGKEWYVGSNLITNPSFSENPADNNNMIVGWNTADYKQMYTTDGGGNFLWFAEGGHDGGAYIQANKHTGSSGDGSIGQRWSIQPGKRYFFSFWLAKNSDQNQYIPVVSITSEESTAGGQHEDGANGGRMILGKNGESSEDCLGFANYNNGDWCQTGVSFESDGYIYLQFNARWLKENSIQACFDDFYLAELYDPDVTQPEDIAGLEYIGALSTLETWANNNLGEWGGLYDEVSDWLMEHEDPEGTTVEEIQASKAVVTAKLEAMKEAVKYVAQYEQLLDKAADLLNTTEYAGIDDLNDALSNVYQPYMEEGFTSEDENIPASEYVVTMVAGLEKVINTYLYSQAYSEDAPADYTFLISNPTFETQGTWYIGSSGGDQRLNTVGERTCWNAWRNTANFDNVAVYQDLTELPNGYYTLSADMLTQSGCIHDQHLLAKSSTATAVSPVMTIDGWGVGLGNTESMDSYEWENLTTAKVTVVDGKLTIGAIGTGTDVVPSGYSDYRQGWFCVTNFKLNYYGPLSDEDILAAYNAKVADLQAQADTMHFAGDKAAYEAVIKANNSVTAVEGVADALAALSEAEKVATASETKYAEVVAGTYAGLQDSIQNAYGARAAQIVTKAVDLATAEITAANATYTTMDAMTTKLRYYRDSYVPAFAAAEALDVSDAAAKAAMEGTLDDEVKTLTAVDTIPGTAVLDEHIAIINNAVKVCQAADLIAAGGTDFTALITNPTVEDESGWTFNRIEGNTNVGSGQNYDDSDSKYLDSWNGTAGKLLYTAYQTIENIPNGVYELKTMNRATGTVGAEGVYTYAIADNDSVNAVFKAIHQEQMNITEFGGPTAESGADSIAYVSDTYGSIFAEAWKATNGGADVEPGTVEEGILQSNNGHGRGWFYNTLQVEVKNHTLTIGVTTDSTFTLGHVDTDGNPCVPFSGTWMSCDNFTLTQISAGDNEGWNPATGIAGVENEGNDAIVVRVENGTIVSNGVIYSISGARVANGSKVPAGVYVVRLGNTAKKVLVK